MNNNMGTKENRIEQLKLAIKRLQSEQATKADDICCEADHNRDTQDASRENELIERDSTISGDKLHSNGSIPISYSTSFQRMKELDNKKIEDKSDSGKHGEVINSLTKIR